MKKSTRLSSNVLSISFWAVLIIIVATQWITNDLVMSDTAAFMTSFIIGIGGTTLLTANIILLTHRLALKRSAKILWAIAALFPVWGTILLLASYSIFTNGVLISLASTGPVGFEWMGERFLFVLAYSLIYFLIIAQPAIQKHRTALSSLIIGIMGIVLILIISLAHALTPTPADTAVRQYYVQTTGAPAYSVQEVRWYHRCCDQTLRTSYQRANMGVYTVEEPGGSVKYYRLGDGNRDNEFNSSGGHQDWKVTPITRDEAEQIERYVTE